MNKLARTPPLGLPVAIPVYTLAPRVFALLLIVYVLLLPAIWNGYPLVFSDTGTYLSAVMERRLPAERPIFYSIFVFLLHWGLSLWPIVIAQALITFYVIRLFFKTFARRFKESNAALCTVLLALLTGLPWFVGQVMPDVFAGLLILTIVIGVFGQVRLGRLDTWLCCGLTAFFVSTHLSYVPLGAGTLVFALFARWLANRASSATSPARSCLSPRDSVLALAIVTALALLLTSNLAARKGFTVAYGGNVMLLAKLLDQGIAQDYLTERCPRDPLPICASLPKLVLLKQDAIRKGYPVGHVSDDFLWGGVLTELGSFGSVSRYASSINHGAIAAYPVPFIKGVAAGFYAQIFHFNLGDDLVCCGLASYMYGKLEANFDGATTASYRRSVQFRQGFNLKALRAVSNLVTALGFAGIVFFVLLRWGEGRATLRFPVVIAFGILLNALVTGGLSAVHDRYGARVIWLLPLLAIFLYLEYLEDRKPPPLSVPHAPAPPCE